MAAPTEEELQDIFEELNYPSATKLRAAVLKRGFKATLKSLEKFVDSQTPGQLFKKHPLFKGKSIATRPNERIMVDLIDYTQQPAGRFKYIMLAIDVFSRHVWGKAMASKTGAAIAETFKTLAADIGEMKELNGDIEFEQSAPLQTYLRGKNIMFRAKKNVNDLAILDSNMGHLKKQIAKDMQQNNTEDWVARLPKVLKGHNKNAHQSLLNETPDEVYHKPGEEPKNNNTEFEMREQAGRQMAAQHNVTKNAQRGLEEKGAFREYIGRPDARKRGDRPNYSGSVKLVSSIHGNTVKATDGTTHSLTTIRPVDKDAKDVRITLRLAGSAQTENRKRAGFQKYADKLEAILASNPRGMRTSDASVALRNQDATFKDALKGMTFTQFTNLFPELFETQTGAAGGGPKYF